MPSPYPQSHLPQTMMWSRSPSSRRQHIPTMVPDPLQDGKMTRQKQLRRLTLMHPQMQHTELLQAADAPQLKAPEHEKKVRKKQVRFQNRMSSTLLRNWTIYQQKQENQPSTEWNASNHHHDEQIARTWQQLEPADGTVKAINVERTATRKLHLQGNNHNDMRMRTTQGKTNDTNRSSETQTNT